MKYYCNFNIILLFALLAVPTTGFGQAAAPGVQAQILIRAEGPQPAVNRRLLGQNVLFAGNGMWDPRSNDLHPRAARYITKLHPTVLRFPGGSISNTYLWEDGLGVRTAGPVTACAKEIALKSNPRWPGVTRAYLIDPGHRQHNEVVNFREQAGNWLAGLTGVSRSHPAGAILRPESRPGQPSWFTNSYGIIEHLKVCQALGALPLLTVNYATGLLRDGLVSTAASRSQKVKRAAAWVAFLNGSPADNRPLGVDDEGRDWRTVAYWAQRRAALGHPEPYGVDYWEIGNEQYDGHEKGFTAARRYGEDFVLFARAMKQVDPKIKIGAVGLADRETGDADQDGPWNAAVLDLGRAYLDFLVLHPYYPTASATQAQGYNSRAWFAAVLGAASQADAHLKEIRALIDQSCGDRAPEIKLVISEYGIWPADSQAGRDYSNLARALYDADLLLTLLKHGRELGVTLAAAWNLHGSNQTAAIRFDFSTEARVLRPQYFVSELLQSHLGQSLLPTQVTSPMCSIPRLGNVGPLQDIPCLQVLATRNSAGRLCLWVLNRSLDQNLAAAVTLPPGPGQRTAVIQTLNGPSPAAHNEAQLPQVGIRTEELPNLGATFRYTFPAHSLTVMAFKEPSPANAERQ